ncbi:hypothetical protein NA56DRAFT_627892 [Hyaloscypha hepaticicola]|uniref:Uncharacterized protein n=1 Tax=Hyaloscypha hepaticicola TaxID=2082293 RepID=A0A2J6Q1F0_9HELO|nr:hypothetical protein NA56DRAFT_627892 [Hyaloscypha hepaticicola]
MAGIVTRVSGIVAKFQNEHSMSIITNNVDFTLFKAEVPLEYTGLGATISKLRRNDAEEGFLHRTARKLGALFEGYLPVTEELFKAYGTRVSEIASMPSINPHPRNAEDLGGMFASHIGAETTSIWAAATSGSAAIAVHLLGCMLARMFTGPEAISIWFELVKKQKESIRNKQGSGLYRHEQLSSILAAQQDISREELARWDASARAWIQSADQAKILQHKQAMLIMSNASVPVNREHDVYTSVMRAWTAALEAMNNLIKGVPQRVQEGAVLLAMSSWHLYPDLGYFGTSCQREVEQKDPLFTHTALLTLGLEHVPELSKSVYWSLPLAHLQYYGHPVKTSKTIGRENSRVNYKEFAYIILGCLFNDWKAFAATNEQGIDWVLRLSKILGLSNDHRDLNSGGKVSWFSYLHAAAIELAVCDDCERKEANQLMALGKKRPEFLRPPAETLPPLFGLSQVDLILPILKNDQERIVFLRHLDAHYKFQLQESLIRYRSGASTNETPEPEFATVSPIQMSSLKRLHSGELKEDENPSFRHIRWICLTSRQLILEIAELQELERIGERRMRIEAMGELCLPAGEYIKETGRGYNELGLIRSLEQDFFQAAKNILQKKENRDGLNASISCTFFVGDADLASICSVTATRTLDSTQTQAAIQRLIVTPEFLKKTLADCVFDKDKMMSHFRDSRRQVFKSLHACAMMADVYKDLPGASISTRVVTQSLTQAKWISSSGSATPLSIPQAFACIAMFEYGTCNLDPGPLSEVFAMSSGNSLYVAGCLICDPYERQSSCLVRRAIGNIGRAGMTFLISPPQVNMREPDPEKWMAINHNPFDGKLENHFTRTSIHLVHTDCEIPLIAEDNPRHNIIDQAAVLLETCISVHDCQAWVGEVDILKANRTHIRRLACNNPQHQERPVRHSQHTKDLEFGKSGYLEVKAKHPQLVATSVQNWDELIEAPTSGVIAIQAHKNWLARLAATAICVRNGFTPIILPEEPCWDCCAAMIPQNSNDNFALIC